MKRPTCAVRYVTGILCLVFLLATTALAQGSASFLTSDTTTQGNWQGKYGADGYFIANTNYQSRSSYATLTPQNQLSWTWTSSTADPRALAIPRGSRGVATSWYNNPGFSLDVNITDGNTHQIALYALDWDSLGGVRSETVQIVDANDPSQVLDTETLLNYTGGTYLVWNISGHVNINVTRTAGANAVISGVFFGSANPTAPLVTSTNSTAFAVGTPGTFTVRASGFPTPALSETGTLPSGVAFNATTGVLSGTPAAGTNGSYAVMFTASNGVGSTVQNFTLTVNQALSTAAAFVGTDTTTQGNWQGKYGADGYFIGSTDYQSPPSYATLTPQDQLSWTWTSGTADPRALAIPGGSGGIASCWYNNPGFSLDVNITDGNTHQIALYALDWDSPGGVRSETVQIVDANNPSQVLDTESLLSYTGGTYLVWSISGHVKINVTVTAGSNAVISGVLFGTPVSVTTTSLAIGQQGTAYSGTLIANGGVTPYTWSITSGSLPAGLALNSSTGAISGIPVAPGSSTFSAKVIDSSSPAQTANVSLVLTIAPATLAITSASLPSGQVGTAYSQTLTATGGTAPYSWSLTSGMLPGGLALNSSTGLIVGTPTAAVNATVLTFKVTDSTTPTAQTNTASFPITMTGHSILLSWVASTSSTTWGYNVYRSNTSGSGYTRISLSPVLGLTYTDTIVVSGQTYYYVTTAVDSSGNESVLSNQIQEVIP